jgi:hypothetical protein
MSQRRRAKQRKKADRSKAREPRKPGKTGLWFGGEFLEDFVFNRLFLPFYAVFAIIMVMGIPLYVLVDRCSSEAAKRRRAQQGPNGEGEMDLVVPCGLVTLGGVMVPVGSYFASPWLLYGGLVVVGLVLITVGVRSVVRWLRAGLAVGVGRPPDVDR